MNCSGPSPRDAACEEPWDVSGGDGKDGVKQKVVDLQEKGC